MAIVPEDWTPIAHTLGYKTEYEMLHDLYEVQNFSFTEIAHKLGYSKNNVRRRLLFNEIPFRSRGGSNNLGKNYLANVTDEELKDAHKVAAKNNVHVSTVYKEIRRRNPCSFAPSSLQSTSTDIVLPEPPTSALPTSLSSSLDTETGLSSEHSKETQSS